MDIDFRKKAESIVNNISDQVKSRAFRAANELRNVELEVLRGQRSGRIYKKPFVKSRYQASAPGEAPAVRSGNLRESWRPRVTKENQSKSLIVKPGIATNLPYAPILEEGYDKGPRHMDPRPYEDTIIEKAKPNIDRIFSEPYLK